MSQPTRVNWFRVLIDLDRAGYRLPRVSATTRIPIATLKEYRNNERDPRHSAGDALIELWCKVLERKRPDLPTVAKTMSVSEAKR